jgi:site-specific recombinase XerD
VGTYAKYELELKRLIEFCGTRNVFTVSGLDLELLNDYKATWPERFPSTNSQHVTQLHIKVFLNYLLHMKGGLAKVPKLDPIKVTSEPTLPLTDAEYEKVLGAAKTKRTRAVIQLMRHSGLAIRDAACLPKSALVMDAKHKTAHVVTKRQKTGTNVRVLVRWAIAEEIKAASLKDGQNLFYNGNAQPISWTRHVGQDVIYTFARAGVNSPSHMVTHRLRDTFACGLLSGGVPMEEVSKLLGHKTIATTEASYSAWVPARQARVDALVAATW